MIRRVSVVSTGSVRIRPQHVESDGTPLLWWLTTSRRWTEPRPINVYVIEHDDGLVLFDTGQDRRSVTAAQSYFPGGPAGFLYRRLAAFEIPPEATLTARLTAIGLDIADVGVAVVSHLHQDHIGGLAELPASARLLVGAADLAAARRPGATLAGYLRDHIDAPGRRWQPVRPSRSGDPAVAPFTHAHDVLGDGSLLLLPTPGHTPGSLSMLVRPSPDVPPLMLVGDVTYDVERLAEGRVPGVGQVSRLRRTTALINGFVARNPGTAVLAAHDPAAAGLLAAAMRNGGSAAR